MIFNRFQALFVIALTFVFVSCAGAAGFKKPQKASSQSVSSEAVSEVETEAKAETVEAAVPVEPGDAALEPDILKQMDEIITSVDGMIGQPKTESSMEGVMMEEAKTDTSLDVKESDALELKVKKLEAKLAQATAMIDDKEEEIVRIQKEKEVSAKELLQVRKNRDELQNRIKQLSREVEGTIGDTSKLEEELKMLKRQLRSSDEQIHYKEEELSGYSKDSDKVKDDLAMVKKGKEELAQKMDDLDDKMENLSDTMQTQLTTMMEPLQERIVSLESKLEEKEQMIAQLSEQPKVEMPDVSSQPQVMEDVSTQSDPDDMVDFGYPKDEGDIPIREQSVQTLQNEMEIEQRFQESKNIKIPNIKMESGEETQEEVSILTDEEIIKSLVKPENEHKLIDLDFDEVKLSDIFMTLGKAAGVNVMLDPQIKGFQLDLHLKQVSLEESFILIANAYDLGFKRVKDSLYVTLKDKLREENLVSKVVKVRNISAQVAQTMVTDVIKSVSVSDEINSLILKGSPAEIKEAEDIIRRIDIAQPQVIIQAQIIEVNKDALREIGIDWQDQVLLNYVESDRTLDITGEDSVDAKDKFFVVNSFDRSPVLFTQAIQMLETQNKAKILSNPRVTTMNDKEAEIFVGDEIPYTITTVTGGVASTEVRFVEPGIRLRITPSIIDDEFVVIKVEPEVSFIFAFRGPNDEFPHVKTREAVAHVRVRNNQPFILGGLLNQEDKENLFKVPFLGDVPLLGNLFSYEKHTVLDTELIITITPTIVRGLK